MVCLIRTNLPTLKLAAQRLHLLVCRMTSSVRSITSKPSSYLCYRYFGSVRYRGSRLAGDFGFTGDVHNWYKTYLEARTCGVIINGDFSSYKHLIYGVRLLGPRLSPTILSEWVTLFTNMVSSITYMRTMFKFIPSLTQIVLVMLYVPCSIYLAVSRIYRLGCSMIGWSWIKRKLNFLLLHPPTITVPCSILLLILMVMRFPLRLPFATWVSFLTTLWPWRSTSLTYPAP